MYIFIYIYIFLKERLYKPICVMCFMFFCFKNDGASLQLSRMGQPRFLPKRKPLHSWWVTSVDQPMGDLLVGGDWRNFIPPNIWPWVKHMWYPSL